MKVAYVLGSEGRLGRAFSTRLRADGFQVLGYDRGTTHNEVILPADAEVYFFDMAYQDDPAAHVLRVAKLLSESEHYAGVFIPSSMWIGVDSAYGRAKLIVEQMAALWRSLGTHVVTDRIGYFPGDGVLPDPRDRFISDLVTGDALYARVMEKLLCSA